MFLCPQCNQQWLEFVRVVVSREGRVWVKAKEQAACKRYYFR
jgi:exosome complex RNA-binding protein Rrp4